MGRLPRMDGPDTWHHVMNRGVARRTVFEGAQDVRYFLSRLARAVRSGRIEVHSYCLLTTHFHLLVRSPKGELSEAMRLIQNDYVRWFNRSRRRDGALFRGRFRSRPVETPIYREWLLRYIDFNPIQAGLVPDPALYPHGSARWYARAQGPPWLERSWVEETVRSITRMDRYDPRRYPECFGEPISAGLRRVVEQRIELSTRAEDPLDDLIDATPEAVLEWMRRKARLGDGTPVGLPVCDARTVRSLVEQERALAKDWTLRPLRRAFEAWVLAECALLRDLCASTWREIGRRTASNPQAAWRTYLHHADCLQTDDHYAQVVARLAHAAVASTFRGHVLPARGRDTVQGAREEDQPRIVRTGS